MGRKGIEKIMTVYCDYCKVNHCKQKAVMLFPEDKAKYAIFENGVMGDLVCETHKLMLERQLKPWHVEVTFVPLRGKDFKVLKRSGNK